MDLATARLEVRARLQELEPDFWTETEVTRALNEGLDRFSNEEKWSFLYTVQEGITLPASTATLELENSVAYERHFNLMMLFSGDDRPRMPRRVGPVEGYRLRMRWYTEQSEPLAYYIAEQADITANEVQTVTNAGSTTGNFTLDFDGQTTGNISRGATALVVETALKALSNIGPGDVRCTGGPLGSAAVDIEFRGNLARTNVPLMTLGGTTTNLSISTTTAGGASASGDYVSTIRFVPVLNREATIEYQYIRAVEHVVDETDVLDIPHEWGMAVVAYATGHLFMKELQWSQKADEQFGLYRKIVDDARRGERKLFIDGGFAWGRNEPEWGYIDDLAFVEMVTPPELGP